MRSHNERLASNAPLVESSALPSDVIECLEAMTVVERHHHDEGLRAVVQIDGRGWVYDPVSTRTELLRRWPELSEAQLVRAIRQIASRVRLAAMSHATPQRGKWIHNY